MNNFIAAVHFMAVTLADNVSSTAPDTTILPLPPNGTASSIAKDGLDFFELWISRIGGIIAFIGAVKFALSIKSEEASEQIQAALIMVSGFMIKSAISGNLGVFNIPDTYSNALAETEFKAITDFIGIWVRRVGGLAMLLGSVMFGFATKDNNANTKVTALRTISAGAIAMSVSAMLSTFI